MLPSEKIVPQPKHATSGQFERGTVKLFAKYPAHNNYFCSYEVFIESDVFKPDTGRSAMIYFTAENTIDRAYYDYGRFCYFLPKSVQPMFDEALTNKAITLTVQIAMDANRPCKDQSEFSFRVQNRDQNKAV